MLMTDVCPDKRCSVLMQECACRKDLVVTTLYQVSYQSWYFVIVLTYATHCCCSDVVEDGRKVDIVGGRDRKERADRDETKEI